MATQQLQHVTYSPAINQQAVLEKKPQGHHLVTVRVNMPHLAQYGRATTAVLVYGARFEVKVGDKVRCPPTKLNGTWTNGVVVAVDGYVKSAFGGRLKYVAKPRL